MNISSLIIIHRRTLGVILGLTVLLLLVWWAIGQSLKLALIGDDWLLLYTIRMVFEIRKSLTFTDPRAILCTYCPPNYFLSIIKYFWGYQPFYYYAVSLITRFIAAVGVSAVTYVFTKRWAAAFIAGCLMAVSYIGIQTTDWVFNFNHYLGIAAVAIFLIRYQSTKNHFSLINLFLHCLAFAAAVIVSPPRMHGLFPLILVLEFAWILTESKKYNWKQSLARIGLVLFTYKLVFSGGGYGTGEYNWSQIQKGLEYGLDLINRGQTWFLLNPMATWGNYLVPDKLWTYIWSTNFLNLQLSVISFRGFIFPIGMILFMISLPVIKAAGLGRRMAVGYGATAVGWWLTVWLVYKNNPVTLKIENVAFALVGGMMMIVSLWMFASLRKHQTQLAISLFLATGWITTFTILPWVLAPYGTLPTWMRYSIQSGAGFAMWIGTICAILGLKRKWLAITIIVLSLGIMHLRYTQQYISTLLAHRDEVTVQRLWDSLHKYVPKLDPSTNSVFYLKYDDYYMAEGGFRFGFSSRAAIEYDIRVQNNNPFMIYEYSDLLSMVTDGQAWTKQGMPVQITSLSRVYAFELKNGQLIDIRPAIMERLKQDSQPSYRKF